MDTNTLPALSDSDDPMLRLAVAAHLARYKGQSRAHTASDLNAYLRWCLEKDLRPLHAKRAHVELVLALAPRSPPPATLDGVAAFVRAGDVLSNLRHRSDP